MGVISAKCETCKWFQPLTKPDLGECRKRAPLPAVMEIKPQKVKFQVIWPEVDATGWCGEYEDIPQKVRERVK